MTDKPTKQKDYTSPALAGAGDYKERQTDKPTKLEGYSRHSRQSSLNNSHVRISHCYYIESKYSGSKTD